MTLFPMFDVPVFWPILVLYWLLLFTVTMKRQIKHMIKYKYLPFSTGKKVGLWRSAPCSSSHTWNAAVRAGLIGKEASLAVCLTVSATFHNLQQRQHVPAASRIPS